MISGEWPKDVQRGLDRLQAPGGDIYQGLAILDGAQVDRDVRQRLSLYLLNNSHRLVKLYALGSLEKIPAQGVFPAVVAVFTNELKDVELMEAVVRTLVALGIQTRGQASEISRLLESSKLNIASRTALIDLLGSSGRLAVAEIPVLNAALASDVDRVRFSAFRALGRIKSFRGVLTHEIDLHTSDYSVFAIIQTEKGTSAESWIEPLVGLVENKNLGLVRRGAAVESLGIVAANHPKVVSRLLDLRLGSEPFLAILALEGLAKVAPRSAGMRAWADRLPTLDLQTQFDAMAKLRGLGAEAEFASESLLQIWNGADGATPDALLAGVLDVFRAMGSAAVASGLGLSDCLPHQFSTYQGRDRLETIRLRAYLMVTLSEIGLPGKAYSYVMDSLAHIDARILAIEIGAAARAVASLGAKGRIFIPYLLEAVTKTFAEEEFSLARFSVDFPPEETTTVELEIINAFSTLCQPGDESAIKLLQSIAEAPSNLNRDARAIVGAKRALALINRKKEPSR